MKTIRIQYTVEPGFADTNRQNIAKVMQELRALNHPGVRYSAYTLDDGKTFMHLVHLKDEEAEKVIPNLEAFKSFQTQLKGSHPEAPPKFDDLALVGSSFDVL